MNFEQLIKRINKNKLTQRKMGKLTVSEIPKGTPIDHMIEFMSFVQVAQKYRDAYEKGEYIPEDLTEEIFAQIEELKKEMAGIK